MQGGRNTCHLSKSSDRQCRLSSPCAVVAWPWHQRTEVRISVTFCHCCCWCAGFERAVCALIGACLACPRHFYVIDILGKACIKIGEAEDNPLPLTGKHAQQQSILKAARCGIHDRCALKLWSGVASPVMHKYGAVNKLAA